MNSMQVKCVIALGKTKSYTKAAEGLYVSQSTVSKNISRLEEELGFKIVKISGHQVEFTERGQYFYKHVSVLHQEYGELLASIYSSEKKRPIIIRHSMVPFERYYLPRFLQEFQKKDERDITLAGFRPYNSYEDNIDLFYENKADFILIQEDFFHGNSRLGFTPLIKGRYSVIINKNNPLAKKSTLNIDDLKNEHIYIWNTNPSVDSVLRVEEALKKVMQEDQITETTGLISSEMYATAGKGVGIVPSFAYDNNINPNVVYHFLDYNLPLTYGAFYLRSTEKAPYFKDIISSLKKGIELEKQRWT